MKVLLATALVGFFAFGLVTPSHSADAAPAAAKKPVRVALVFDKGGKDDKSFNSAAHQGALRAQKELGAFIKYVEATDEGAFEPLLRGFATKDFDIIISVGFAQGEALKKVAALYPQKRFAIVDYEVKGPNVRALLFEEHEGSYLVGAMAGLMSKSGKVGFLGGMDIPLIRRFEMGYEAGVKKVNPKATISAKYVGVTGDAWNNPARAKELSKGIYEGGADVIFGAAGASNNGMFDAAEEKKKLSIGVDSNQNWVKPGFVLTSMLKRVDVAVFDTIKTIADGTYKAEVARFGLQNQGVDFAMDEYNAKLVPADVLKQVNDLKQQIIAGKIVVPDFYKKK